MPRKCVHACVATTQRCVAPEPLPQLSSLLLLKTRTRLLLLQRPDTPLFHFRSTMGSSMSSQVVLVSSGNASNNQVACANCFKYGSQCYLKTTASRKTSPPARSVDKASLPPRPSTICQVCWEGPFAAHLGLFAKRASTPWFTSSGRCTEGYSYSSSWAELESRAGAGCTWCGFLFAMRTGSDMTSAKSDGPLKISASGKTSRRNSAYFRDI